MLARATIGIKELQNFNVAGYDIVDIEDKRTKELKGLFVSSKYAEQIREYIEKLEKKKTQKIKDEFEAICGIGTIGEIDIKTALKDRE